MTTNPRSANETADVPVFVSTMIDETLSALSPERRPAFQQRLLDTFKRSLDTRLQTLHQTPASDFVTIGLAAHTLKSAAAQLGALRLSQVCRDLEAAARDGAESEISALVATLPELADQTWVELKAHLT